MLMIIVCFSAIYDRSNLLDQKHANDTEGCDEEQIDNEHYTYYGQARC
jgi:hypothetical protein